MTHGSQAEPDRHIIPHYQTAGEARYPPAAPCSPSPSDPADAEQQIIPQECALGQVEGSIRVKKALWRHLRPLCCLRFLRDWRLPKVRQQLWIQRRVWFGRGACFHRKNIFIDKTFVFCPKLFCWIYFFFLLGCQTVARRTSPAIVFIEAIIGIFTYGRGRHCWFYSRNADVLTFDRSLRLISSVLINSRGSSKGCKRPLSTAGFLFNP